MSKNEDGSSDGSSEPLLSDNTNSSDYGDSKSLVGIKLGKYKLEKFVAKGGSATVYLGVDEVLNREVAVKVLHEHLEAKSEIVQRFKNEAQVVAQLRHPNIVTVYDFFVHNGRTILVTEYMPGMTLSQLIRKTKKIPENIVLMMGLEMLQGLKEAHQKGIMHRDIKPANVLLHADYGVKLSDFGLAKLVNSDEGLTKSGLFVGTPSFSSPEQIEGKTLDQRSDLFSIGLTLYMMATRRHAFKRKGDSTTTVWFKIVKGKFEGVRDIDPNLSPDFDRIIRRSLEVDREKRYPNAQAMMTDLEALLKKRESYPYQNVLTNFLGDPSKASSANYGGFHLPKWIRKTSKAVVLLGLLLGGAYLAWQNIPWAPEMIPGTKEEETVTPPPIETETQPTPAEPPQETKPEPKVEEKAEPKPAPAPEPKPKPKPEPRPERKPVQPEVRFPEAHSVSRSANIIRAIGDQGAPLKIVWKGSADFLFAEDANFNRVKMDEKFPSREVPFANLSTGQYHWKAGGTTGVLQIETINNYRERVIGSKRALLVSSQYGEAVDLEMNPWVQQLRLSWEQGPDARSYRLEVASDAEFRKTLFSGVIPTKSFDIERNWEKGQTVYWRVSFLDEFRNVFYVEPTRRINLRLKGSAPYFDIMQPIMGDSVRGEMIDVEVLGPSRNASVKCTTIQPGEKISNWLPLAREGSFYTGQFKRDNARWIVCETNSPRTKLAYFHIPLR